MTEVNDVKLLEDRSLEIPMFLQRDADNTLKYPDAPVPPVRVTSAVTQEDERQLNRWGWPANPADEIARRELVAAEAASVKGQQKANQEARAARKKEEKQRLDENKKAQRGVFMQHFNPIWE